MSPTTQLKQAYKYCKQIATHKENFPVASLFIPKNKRKHFYAIYAFARTGDDIADELSKIDFGKALQKLDTYERKLKSVVSGTIQADEPLFLALHNTIKELNLPLEPFLRLITAFRSDINFQQPNDWDDVLAYCENSANPVGKLILHIFDEVSDEKLHYSNCICTGLQLINFWQDINEDLARGRCYIPKSVLGNKYYETTNIKPYISTLLKKTNEIYVKGEKLLPLIKSFRLRLELKAIYKGGKYALRKLDKENKN